MQYNDCMKDLVFTFASIQKTFCFCMKNRVAILLCCLYFCAFSGATITVHYCMNSVASVSFDKPYKSKDCRVCEKKKKACCEERQTLLKSAEQHEAALQTISFKKYFAAFVSNRYQLVFLLSHSHLFSYKNKNANFSPPVPLYQAQCVYRI